MTTARFIVLEEADTTAVDAAVAELAGAIVRVANVEDAGQAVLAALAGAHLIIDATAPREVIDQLCDDLRRIGDVDHRIGSCASPSLGGEERALLSRLLAGATLGEAARALHLSRRTADRRLAAARAALHAGSTAEALRRAAELGVKPAE